MRMVPNMRGVVSQDATVGHLVMINIFAAQKYTPHFAICAEVDTEKRGLIVLNSDRGPASVAYRDNQVALDLGTDWSIEPDLNSLTFQPQNEPYGALVFNSDSSLSMRVMRGESYGALNLVDFTVRSALLRFDAMITRWTIVSGSGNERRELLQMNVA